MATANAMEIRGLEKKFPSFKMGPLDLTVPRGAIYGLLGPNGAGKTTTIDIIMGMGMKDAGSIEVFGLDHVRDEVAVKKQIGYVGPDLSFNAWGRVNRCISFMRTFYPDWDDAYCADLLKRLRIGERDRISTLSFGSRSKLALVIALSHHPDLLLLDEPLAGLDALSKQEVYTELLHVVQDDDRTVVVSSHDLHNLERLPDHIGIINEGRLLMEGPTAELVSRFALMDCILPENCQPELLEGIRVLRQETTRWRLLADLSCDPLQLLQSKGAEDVVTTAMTLEDIFLALIRSADHVANCS